MTPIKYAQLHFATDALVERLSGPDVFSLHFPTEQGGCTVTLDQPTLEQLSPVLPTR
ncbi:hypothetical protein [Mesorhizobium sp. M0633]|uniref:hypothetical protein n=1 Tax=Mesorhizobium sp. M0633 TaxID=2956977 RepID=UPI003338F0A1